MNAPLIGALRVSLSAETAAFETGMKRAQRTTATSAAGISKSLGTIKSSLATLGVGIGVGLFARAVKNALDYAGSLAEVAQQVGVTAKDLQVLRFAGSQVGISTEGMDKALQKFTKSLGDARNGSAEAIKTFKALGFTDQDIKRLDAHEALLKTADGLAKVTDRASRASPEVRLFGKAGQQLDTLLAGGSQRINELAQAAEKLGVVLSDEQIAKADETADKLTALKTVLSANIASVVADNAQSILALSSSLTALTAAIIRFMGSNPTAALAIIGALAGSRFGLPGAALGALAGSVVGSQIETPIDQAALDKKALPLMRHNLQLAKKRGDTAAAARLQARIDAAEGKTPSITQPVGANLGQFLAGGGSKGAEDHSAENALRAGFQFDQELRRAQMDVLRATQSLATDYVERTTIGIQILDAEKAAFDAEQKYQVALFKLTKGKDGLSEEQSKQLTIEHNKTDALERQALLDEEQAKRQEEFNQLEQVNFDLERDRLQSEAQLAETASERRDAELRLLDLAYRQERARQEAILADEKASFAAKEEARRRLANLDQTYANDRAGVIASTRGPMEDYLASLPTTAAKAQEALERLQVQGFEGLIDAALELTNGFDNAAKALLNTLKQFFLGMARMELQRGLGSLLEGAQGQGGILGSIFGGIFGSSGGIGGGTTAGMDVSFGSATPLASVPVDFGFAQGGGFTLLGRKGIDQNVMSINGLPIARVSYGERVNISNDNGMGWNGGKVVNQNFSVNTPDADSFRRSERQILTAARRRLG